MKQKSIGYFFSLLLMCAALKAQDANYWQQEVNYSIDVELDDQKHFLYGSEEIQYINNSPDALTYLYFHLWPNAYKNNGTAFAKQMVESGDASFYFANEDRRGYIDSLDFRVNGERVSWEYHPEHIDICKITLNEPLQSGDSITIATPFRVKIPYTFSRLGRVGQQYQITQWYPKPAVYDQDGWHPMPYLDIGEFYSEFGRFEVNITVPENYVVAATGVLQNESEQAFLDSLAEEDWREALYRYAAPQRDTTVGKKTLTYVQDNVHDFAWFADKGYKIMQGEVELPHSGRTVRLQAFYSDFSFEVWQNVIEYMHDAVYYFSDWIGDYPYDVVTVVDGALGAGSGMEYPTITVLGAGDRFFLEMVTMHEIGHNWFYGALGSNERIHPWMDEGINSYYEMRYIETKLPETKITQLAGGLIESSSLARWIADRSGLSDMAYTDLYALAYLVPARQNRDQPPGLPSDEFTQANYGAMVYQKTAMIFYHLSQYLGQDEFDRIMQTYYETWKFKHPQPEDLQSLFERESGKDLDWLFGDLIETTKAIDYKIQSATSSGVTVENTGGVASPTVVAAYRDGEEVERKWIEGVPGKETVAFEAGDVDRFVIDPDSATLELYRHNNYADVGSFLPKAEPVEFKFLGAVEDPSERQLFYAPVFGLNTRDKFMLGGALHNYVFPQRKFTFGLMPMYSFGLNKLAGSAEFSYNIYPNRTFRKIDFSALAKSYAGYTKLEGEAAFDFQPKSLRDGPRQSARFRFADISVSRQELPLYDDDYQIVEGVYNYVNGDAVWRYGFNSRVRVNPGEFVSWDNQLRLNFQYVRGAFLTARIFHGRFMSGDNVHPSFHYGMSGSFDYMMDEVFFDRAMISVDLTAFEIQTDLDHGGFRGFSPVTSANHISVVNLDADIPGIGLFTLFGDFGVTPETSGLLYDAGIKITIVPNVLDFYFPVAGEPYEDNFPDSFNNFFNNLRFRFQLDNLNPINRLLE